MKTTKKLLSLFVTVVMLMQMFGFTGIVPASAQEQIQVETQSVEVDWFDLLGSKGYLAVAADGDGTNDGARGIKARANENSNGGSTYMLCHDISQVQIDSNNQLVESEALTDVLGKLAASGMSDTNARNVITYAKINGKSNYVTNNNDGAYFKTTKTDGVTEKAVWDGVTYCRYRLSSKGGDATYNAQLVTSMGPYMYATDTTFDSETNLTYFIEYFDEGTGSFSLWYHAADGTNKSAGNVTKTNTNTWKTAIISVTDANTSASNSSTGYVHGKDDFRFQGTSRAISRFMVVRTSDYEAAQAGTVVPTDFSAFENYGIYSYAGDDNSSDTESGMTILDYTNEGYDNRLYHYVEDKAYLDATMPSDENLKGAYDKLVEHNSSAVKYQYLTRTVDGPWKYKQVQNKNSYFTITAVRNREPGREVNAGALYFKLNNDVINENVSDVTFIVEYFDYDANDITLTYLNTSFTNNGNASTSPVKIDRKGTKTWKTEVFHATDAKMDKDWNKTGLGNGYASIKIQGPGTDFYLGRILAIPTSTYSNMINPPAQQETVEAHNDGINWWNLVKEKGVYVEASNPTANTGLSAMTANRIYDLNNASDVAAIGSQTINGKTVDQIKAAGFAYATLGTADNATNISSATSGDGVYKDTFFTVRNYRNSSSYNVGGNMYFKVTSDIITSSDDDVYVVMEYLDYDPNMTTTQNSNGTFNYKNQSSISPTFAVNEFASKVNCKGFPTFYRHNTNRWRTVAIPVSEAQLTNTNSLTGLVDNTYDIKLSANNVPTHVSRIGVVKASDVGIGTHTYYAPEVAGSAPQIFLAGDSIVEQLDYTNAYPRATIGMEIGKYFKQKTISNAATYTYDANDYRVTTTTNEGVTIVNRAKGGKSTRSFLNQVDPPASDTTTDTRWNDIKSLAKKGDYLFLSFCINDVSNRTTVQTSPYLVGDTGDRFSHRANIKEFKDACDQLGVNLVLLTPIPGRGLGSGSDAHIASLFAQGRELGIPVLDVHTYYKALVKSFKDANDLGVYNIDKTKLLYNYIFDDDINADYSSSFSKVDDTHVNITGANEICKIIIQEIQRKASTYASINELAKWVDTSKDITTIAAPAHQEANIRYSVSDVTYIVDGQEYDDYKKGEVSVRATVTNVGDSTDDAVVYVALYDGQGDLSDVVVSPKATIEPGATTTLTTPVITVPELDGYKLRMFIWNSDLKPYDRDENMIVLMADAGNRSVNLEWSLKKDLGNVTFDIYRDDLLIKSTTNGGYVDDGVDRGAHTYQINVVKDGDVIYQSPIALADVTNFYEVKQDPDIFYVKAGLNSMNQKANMNGGLKLYETGATPTFPQDAVEAWNLTDADITASYGTTGHKFQGNPLVVVGGDGSYRVEKVKDKYGIEKTAFMSAAVYRPNVKGAVQAYLYVDETNTANFTSEDTNITIFIEFLANKDAPTIQYWGSTTAEDGTVSYSLKPIGSKYFSGRTGDWRIARYDITDAYFAEDTSLADECMFRIVSGWGTPNYISSIVVVKGDTAKANEKFAKLNNLEFSEYNVKNASKKYPNGVSIDFSSGTPVKDGMDIEYSTSGTGDNLGEVAIAADGVGYYGTKQAIQNNALKGTYLYFKVDKDYILGADGKLVVDITYKADYDAPIKMLSPMYYKESNTASAGNNTVVLAQMKPDSTNNWKTVQCVVDKTNFVHFDNNGAAFRLQTDQSLADANKQLRISSIRVRNMDSLPVNIENQATDSKTTIHIAADSIAATYSADRTAENGIMGWGQVLGDYLKTDRISVNNKATPGASTVTFANMPSILSNVKEGDYVLISFGHNDQMTNKFVDVDDYKANLTNWINQIREKKGVPVLVTMIPQGNSQTGYLVQSDSFDERRAAVAEVAQNTDTMLVKLGEQMFEDETNGVITTDDVKSMYCIENDVNQTHVVESGARYIAQIIVEKLSEVSPFFGTYVK